MEKTQQQKAVDTIRAALFCLQDEAYRDFQSALMPTVSKERVIGVRTPKLRKLAKQFGASLDAPLFLESLPHQYYEENNLHGLLIGQEKQFDKALARVDAFLPFVDNWATCDMLSPGVFAKNLPALLPHIRRWLQSEQVYTVRFALNMLLRYYLDDAFRPEYLEWAAAVRREEYYLQMMVAWYFATALAKQYDAAVIYLQQGKLPLWVHNKTIQKARESRRISPAQKEYLNTLRKKRPKQGKNAMQTRREAIDACLSFPNTWEDYPFDDPNWTVMRHADNKKCFALIFERQGKIWMNLKAAPQWGELWKRSFAAVVPAYHMNKTHWISVILDGTIPDQQLLQMIEDSFLLTQKKTSRPPKPLPGKKSAP